MPISVAQRFVRLIFQGLTAKIPRTRFRDFLLVKARLLRSLAKLEKIKPFTNANGTVASISFPASSNVFSSGILINTGRLIPSVSSCESVLLVRTKNRVSL